MVVFGKNLLYWGIFVVIRQSGFIRARWLYSGKVVVIEQNKLYSGKVLLFGQELLYSGRSSSIPECGSSWEKVAVIGKKWLY